MAVGLQGILIGSLAIVGLGFVAPEAVLAQTGEAIATEMAQAVGMQGNQIRLNGKTIRGNWAQWSENGTTRFGIESMTLEKSLGMELLNTESLTQQPVAWFDSSSQVLPIKFANPYRYLDVTELVQRQQWQWRSQGNILDLQTPNAKISGFRMGYQTWGQRIVVDLDAPVVWRLATPTQVAIQGSFQTPIPTPIPMNEPSGLFNVAPKPALPFEVTTQGSETILTFPEAIAPQIQVSTLANPPRLLIDLRQDQRKTRSIQWLAGVRWRQENFGRGQGVTMLELDPTRANLQLLPITPANNTVVGIQPMITQAETNQAIAAINAGFFNRNNQYPLGVMRRNGEWLSGPILNRGAVAWDNAGRWEFDRLSVQEQITASNGQDLSLELINSGYVKAGAARYTSAWGSTYKTLTDNEVVLTVINEAGRGEIVSQRQDATKQGVETYNIPQNGYLLVFRSFRSGADKLPVGVTLRRTENFNPASFGTLPNVMGGGPLLVKNGQVVLNAQAEQFNWAFNIQSASRSAIARTRDNKIILATLHGTAEETAGATLGEWANILVKLGATDALNLDGGGSSALVIGGNLGDRHSSTAGRVNNGIGLFIE